MTTKTIGLKQHRRDNILKDVHFTSYHGHILTTYVTEHGEPRVFEVVGKTRNPRVMHLADAIVDDGQYQTTHYNGTYIITQHPMAGVQERYLPQEWTDEPVLLLEKLPPARL